MTTIKLKNGSGAPTSGDLVQGEPALDLTNKRLYTENASGTVIEVGINPTSVTTGDITATGTATFAGLTTTADVSFGDNDKAIFGASSDLQIYHTGSPSSNSVIEDAGAGNLTLKSNGAGIHFRDGSDSLVFNVDLDSATTLYHNTSAKLATTSTGINVTGSISADGLTVDGTNAGLTITGPSSQLMKIATTSSLDKIAFAGGDGTVEAMRIDSNGDISFYEDTGTTAKFFWDASAESLGIGTSSPSRKLDVRSGAFNSAIAQFTGANDGRGLLISTFSRASNDDSVDYDTPFGGHHTFSASGAEKVRITNTGNVGIGQAPTAFANWKVLELKGGTSGAMLNFENSASTRVSTVAYDDGNDALRIQNFLANPITFETNNTERMRIDSSGLIQAVSSITSDPTNTNAYFYNKSGVGPTLSGYRFSIRTGATPDESLRVDESGNLLVGKTTSDLTTDGFEVRPTGFVGVRTNGDPLYLNRKSTDGAIATFAKDGTTVGSIQSRAGLVSTIILDPRSGSLGTGITGSGANLSPTNGSGTEVDARNDIGTSTYRFKDLYLSGTPYIGGTSAGQSVIQMLANPTNGANTIHFGDSASGSDTYAGYINYAHDSNSMQFATNQLERMRLDSSGNLLVGTTSLADVNNIVTNHLFEGANSTAGAGAVGVYNNTGTANCPALVVLNRDASTDTSNRFIQFYADVSSSSSTAMGGIVGNGASNVQFAALSDAREKTNIESISGSLDKINTLNPVEFDWIASGEHVSAGFVAQEVEQVFPEFVVENMADEGAEERKGLTGGMTGGIVAHLVKAIQEQNELINELRARVAQLETN